MARLEPIYAFPDHEVVQELIPGIESTYLSQDEALSRIRDNPGIVPVAIDHTGGGRLYWADIGDYPYREWQFLFTIQTLANEGRLAETFVTDVEILLAEDLLGDQGLGKAIQPSGFIFHVSRCGSTLVGKALARLPEHVVINQGGPLQRGFWAYLTDDWRKDAEPSARNLKMFKNLVFAMARQRRPEQSTAFVKFISWNALYIDFVTRAFPDIPSIFMYRDPVEVIASVMKETTAALVAKGTRLSKFLAVAEPSETSAMNDSEYLAKCYSNYFRVMLSAVENKLALLNYRDLNPTSFVDVLSRGLNFQSSPEDLATMLQQFRFHSKDDSDVTEFKSDSDTKRAAVSDDEHRTIERECARLLDQLDRATKNLFPITNQPAHSNDVTMPGR